MICERIDSLVAEREATKARARRALWFHDECAEARALVHLWAVEEQLAAAADELDDILDGEL